MRMRMVEVQAESLREVLRVLQKAAGL